MEFECPNCGELLDEDAEVCPFCGSDEETGWNQDVDYYSVELPDDEFDEEMEYATSRSSSPRWRGLLLVTVATFCLAVAGWSAYGWGVVAPLLFFLICGFVFVVGTGDATR